MNLHLSCNLHKSEVPVWHCMSLFRNLDICDSESLHQLGGCRNDSVNGAPGRETLTTQLRPLHSLRYKTASSPTSAPLSMTAHAPLHLWEFGHYLRQSALSIFHGVLKRKVLCLASAQVFIVASSRMVRLEQERAIRWVAMGTTKAAQLLCSLPSMTPPLLMKVPLPLRS